MTKHLMVGAAVGALMVTGALAQAPSAPSRPGSTPPAASTPSQPAPGAASTSQAGGEKADFVMSQKPDQLLATKFKGTDVVGADNKKIGDVSDILFDKTGKIEAYVVAVGGFLGMGAKEIALAPSSFDLVPADKGGDPKLKLSMTEEQLKNAQAFARYEPPRPATTTGAGGSMGGGPRPSTNTPPTGR